MVNPAGEVVEVSWALGALVLELLQAQKPPATSPSLPTLPAAMMAPTETPIDAGVPALQPAVQAAGQNGAPLPAQAAAAAGDGAPAARAAAGTAGGKPAVVTFADALRADGLLPTVLSQGATSAPPDAAAAFSLAGAGDAVQGSPSFPQQLSRAPWRSAAAGKADGVPLPGASWLGGWALRGALLFGAVAAAVAWLASLLYAQRSGGSVKVAAEQASSLQSSSRRGARLVP